MAYYLQWPASTGSQFNNKSLLQISGINGVLSSVEYRVKTDAQPTTQLRYLFDIRRLADSAATGSGTGWIISNGRAGVSDLQKNGLPLIDHRGFFDSYVADDVFKFSVNSEPSDGCIAIGARHNAVEHNYGLSISIITLVDAAGSHTIDMTSSGGTLSEFQSIDGALTAKLFNFPTDGSQWVEYTPAPTGLPENITWTLESSSACVAWDSVDGATEYEIEFRERN